MRIEEGRVYVAPPDHHLWVFDGMLRLLMGPKENGMRPAIDPLFRSAAAAFGKRVVGILLSGLQDDGVAGMKIIKDRGGVTIVQDPKEAAFPYLPQRALEHRTVDHVCTIEQMTESIGLIVRERSSMTDKKPSGPTGIEREAGEVAKEKSDFEKGGDPETATALTCPECGGAIWEFDREGVLQFRCHVGHAYSEDTFADEQARTVEAAMWTALRALEEKHMLVSRLMTRARERGAHNSARRFEKTVAAMAEKADLIRRAIVISNATPESSQEQQ